MAAVKKDGVVRFGVAVRWKRVGLGSGHYDAL